MKDMLKTAPEIKAEFITSQTTREEIQKNKNTLFIYGDNDQRTGLGGAAKVARGEPNSTGIRTKKLPSLNNNAFYTDSELEINKKKIREDIQTTLETSKRYSKIKIFPLGEGLASLKEKAPLTYAFLQKEIQQNFFELKKEPSQSLFDEKKEKTTVYNGLDKIKENNDFVKCLENDGWNINKKKCNQNSRYQVLQKGERTLLVFYPSNCRYRLAKEMPFGKAFNLIQYLKEEKQLSYKEIFTKFEYLNLGYSKPKKEKEKKVENQNFDWINKYPSYADLIDASADQYFINKRCLNKKILRHPRLSNIKYHPTYKNLLVPHYDDNKKISCVEYIGMKGVYFPKNTSKTIYQTNNLNSDNVFFIAESVIDLLSYYSLNSNLLETSKGISISGNISSRGIEKLETVFSKDKNTAVVLGLDNDSAGEQLSKKILEIIKKVDGNNSRDISFFPLAEKKDINDYLVFKKNSSIKNTYKKRKCRL